jgi:predicted amidohydrolase YtcJ
VDAGFQVTSHAIGGRGIESILHAYEQVLDGKGNPRRHRIDHFELPTRGQVARAVGLDLALTVQPGFTWLDDRFLGGYRRQLAPTTWQRQIPLRTIAEAGGRLVGSSDYPSGPLSPWIHMQGMVDYVVRDEALSVYQALRSYTWNAAWSTGEETDRGSLAVGKKADFIVMEEDPFAMPLADLRRAAVRETWIGGKRAQPMHRSTASFVTRALLGPRKKI